MQIRLPGLCTWCRVSMESLSPAAFVVVLRCAAVAVVGNKALPPVPDSLWGAGLTLLSTMREGGPQLAYFFAGFAGRRKRGRLAPGSRALAAVPCRPGRR